MSVKNRDRSGSHHASKQSACRIIGGKWRGRKIKFGDAEGLRPTTDRIRETVFNWLQPYIQQSVCLDAFSGSGVLGFEALSRGASNVTFVEKNNSTVKNINENIKLLDIKNTSVYTADALEWLQSGLESNHYNLVFLDPPFDSDLLEKSSALLNSSGCLAKDAIIYVEHSVDSDVLLPENWQKLKEKCAGQVAYNLFNNSK